MTTNGLKWLPQKTFVMMVIVVAPSCAPIKQGSRLKNLSDDVFVGLFDPKVETDPAILVSFAQKIEAKLCVTDRDGSCDTNAESLSLMEYGASNERQLYRTATKPNLSSFRDYLIVNKSGIEMLRFRLKSLAASQTLEDALRLLSIKSLEEELTFITHDKFNGRLAGTEDNQKIADFLIGELKKLKISPAFQDYRQQFRMTIGPTTGAMSSNIVGVIEGTDPELKNEYVVIGAHMDHTGTLDKGHTCTSGGGSDRICNGADDNGSGTVALLNVTKSLAAIRGSLKRSVLIIWFSGEEEGLLGSRHYVANPAVPLNKHVFMINLDMVGYAKSFGNAIAAIGTVTSKWGASTARSIAQRYPTHKMKFTEKVEGGSDHAPFMNKGIPAVFYHTGVSNNPNYHKTSDHADKIDYGGMLVATKIALETVVAASGAPELSQTSGLNLAEAPKKFLSDAEATKGCHYLMDYQYID
jgi:hypothetical protein